MVTFEVETNFAKICWTRNPLGYINHEGEVCDSVNENRKIEYSFEDLCSDEARKKQSSGYIICAPIFFRIEGKQIDLNLYIMLASKVVKTLWIKEINYIISGEYTGSSRCTISAANDLPCRMASATEVIISGYGMTCSASINIWSNSLQRNTIFFGALLILIEYRILSTVLL